ncbi:MAG TPA: CPBP family intramembrane glutamic endopeptidase [Thermoanaerobaculia bacterium]
MKARSILEISAVLLTAALHFFFYDVLPARGLFILVVITVWAGYFAFRMKREPAARQEFGLSRLGLSESAKACAAVFAVGLAGCAVVGLSKGRLDLVPQMLILLILYPIWGLIQELLVQAMFVRNLVRHVPGAVVVTTAGVLFGVVHLPHVALAVATALLGAVFTMIFVRWRNVWPLGVCHGWLGVFFYYWVLGRDPWLEILGRA